MPKFEVEANGKRYEIEAPDANAAMDAFSRFAGPTDASVPDQAVPEQPVSPNIAERLGQSTYSALTGASQGATMGAYDELASLVGAPIKGIENLLTGQDQISGLGDIGPFLGRSFQSALQGQQDLNKQAFDQAPVSYVGGDVLGSFGLGGGMASQGVTTFGDIARPTVMGMAGRGAVEGGLTGAGGGFNVGDNGDTSLPGRLKAATEGGVAGALLGGVTGGILGGAAGRAQVDAIPSAEDLAAQAGTLYDAARNSGVAATPEMSQSIADTIKRIAQGENIILPKSGNVDNSYPKIAGVLNVFDEYGGEVLDVGKLQAIRRRIQDAAKSLDPGERRVGTIMLGEFDDFAQGVAPELAEASNLYWRSKVGDLINESIDLAENRSSQYSVSGMENALRTQFRQLNAKIIKGQLKGITPELAEQIRLVADGSPIQNFARQVGKFALRGPVSGGPSIAAALAGGLSGGGPAGALIAGGAIALPGEIGKRAAESIAMRNAQVASALARSGGALPEWSFSPVAGALVQGGANLAGRVLPNF